MRNLIAAAVIAFLSVHPAFAQEDEHPNGWGHVFGAIGGTSGGAGFYHFGGGGAGLLAGGFGAGIDLGATNSTGGGTALGLLSPGMFYAFNRDRKWSPFVGGGYSMLFRSGIANGGYVGGGVSHWLNDSVGLRFEVRDHIFSDGGFHLIEGRVSVLFF